MTFTSHSPASSEHDDHEASAGTSITYEDLLAEVGRFAPSRSRAESLSTALRNWLRFAGKGVEHEIGIEFTSKFDAAIKEFRKHLVHDAMLAESTAHKRVQQVRQLRHAAEVLDAGDALPATLSGALKVLLKRTAQSCGLVARLNDIPKPTLAQWIRGVRPRQEQRQRIEALERYFCLASGALVGRTHFLSSSDPEKRPATAFAARMRDRAARQKVDGKTWLPWQLISEEWTDYVEHKCDDTRDEVINAPNPLHPPLWRTKAPHEVGNKILPQMRLRNGRVCQTAGVSYGHVATYLGWLHRQTNFPAASCASLAWLVDATSVKAHAKYKSELSAGAWHSGISDFLANVMTMTRPESGYLWQNPSVGADLNLTHPAD